jgi:hypothetical protein
VLCKINASFYMTFSSHSHWMMSECQTLHLLIVRCYVSHIHFAYLFTSRERNIETSTHFIRIASTPAPITKYRSIDKAFNELSVLRHKISLLEYRPKNND